MTDKEDTAFDLEQVKKPYRAPELHEYGSIREITRSKSRVGNNDHGSVGVGNDRSLG
jgi:hypothetical protein